MIRRNICRFHLDGIDIVELSNVDSSRGDNWLHKMNDVYYLVESVGAKDIEAFLNFINYKP